ncbi:MAG: SDR family oxidoreductase [Hyphomicrobiaceae bacterium]
MDLGIRGRKAIVCAASKGLGRGCAEALARDGVDLVICARTAGPLQATAAAIAAETGVSVTPVACDITTDAGRVAVLEACPEPDILVNNAGGPPPGDFRDFGLDDWRSAVENNMITPIALIHATVYGMEERGFGRIVNITSASVKNPIPTLELSNGARCGLTGGVASLARRVASSNVTINGILPGLHDTDRVRQTLQGRADADGVSVDEATAKAGAAIPAGRIGAPEDFGAVCAFLCSTYAGFVTGQNIMVDGGAFNGTM